MKLRYTITLFLVGFFLQSTVMHHFAIFGVSPDIILCLTIVCSFLYEGYHGMILGLIVGLISDICFAPLIGVSAMSYFLIAWMCLKLKEYLYKENRVSILVISSVGTLCHGVLFWSITTAFGMGVQIFFALKFYALLILYHGLITMILYHFMRRSAIKHHSDHYMYKGGGQKMKGLYLR